MITASFGPIAVSALAMVFVTGGVAALSEPRLFRRIRDAVRCRRGFCQFMGAVALTAACFLLVPNTRIWGVALAGIMTFGIVVKLFFHRRYLWSVPAVLMLVALVPAAFVS